VPLDRAKRTCHDDEARERGCHGVLLGLDEEPSRRRDVDVPSGRIAPDP